MSNLYFNHSYSLRNETEILEIRAEFGTEAYAIYLMLLEIIAESKTKSINRKFIKSLSLSLAFPVSKLNDIIDFCIELNLFYLENDLIYSKFLSKKKTKKTSEINTDTL